MEVVSLNDLNIKSLCSIFTYIILLNLIIFISVINRILRSNLSYSEKKRREIQIRNPITTFPISN